MHQQSFFENLWRIKWLWIGVLSVCLVSCSQVTSTAATEAAEPDATSISPVPDHTTTPLPAADTLLPPSPTQTATPAPTTETPLPPTETPLPTGTPTHTPTPWPTSEAFFDGARVTFINNAGFLITVGDKKILIDALYETGSRNIDLPPEVRQRAVNAEPPFDQVDLVIATHSHSDHFSAELVRDHLRYNESAVFVSSPDAVRQIQRMGEEFDDRLIAVDLGPGESSHLMVNGIALDCLNITHGIPLLNIGLVITMDDFTFFHSGDMSLDDMADDFIRLEDLQGYGLPQKEIDLALLPIQIFSIDEGTILIEEGIQARYVSPMHYPYQYPPTGIEENFSNAVVFKDSLENWVVPLE